MLVGHLLPFLLPSQALTHLAAFEAGSLVLPLIWFGIIILTLIVESQTADLVSIWFAPGAFVAMILAFCNVGFGVQFGVFIGITVIGLILTFTVIRPRMKKKHKIEKTNADALIGKLAHVEEDIDNRAPSGVVKINGQLWTARMTDDTLSASKDDWVEIAEVAGSKLICRPKNRD